MRFAFPLLLALTFATHLTAQRTGNPALSEGASLQQQFDGMLDVSNRYREGSTEFKVMRRDYLDAFVANVNDSISTYTRRIATLESEQDKLQTRIDETASEVADRDATIETLNTNRDSVTVLGMQFDRATYDLIVWALVIGLLVALLIALASTRVAASNNTDLRRERDKLSEELEQSRKSRLTVEQDLRRQLQDEINRRNA